MVFVSAPQNNSLNKPLISVVMPVYNTEQYVGEAIESILLQTFPNFELIIIDDGSTDGSQKIIAEFVRRDKRVRSIFASHRGTSEAQNTGIGLAKGAYIAHLDADDVSLPERLEVQWDWMQRTGVDVCGSCVKYLGYRSGILWFPQEHGAIRAEMFFRSALLPSAVMMRAEVSKENLHKPGVAFHDYELWTRLVPRYRMGNVQRVLTQYRIHEKQTSRLTAVQVREEQEKYRRRYFFDLFPEAEQEDFAAFECLTSEHSHKTFADLELASSWLMRACDSSDSFSDSFVEKRMAARWAGACCRSADLGMACFYLYCRVAAHFGSIDPHMRRKLRFLCLFRQGSDSQFYRTAKQLFPKKFGQDHAPA
jgi:glycosyltransferase involved in cell wall biosynthesis